MGTTKKTQKNSDSSHASRFFQHYTSWAIKKACMWIKWASSNDLNLEARSRFQDTKSQEKKENKVEGLLYSQANKMLKKTKIKSLSNHPRSDWSISAIDNSINSSDNALNWVVTVNFEYNVIFSPFLQTLFRVQWKCPLYILPTLVKKSLPKDYSETIQKR